MMYTSSIVCLILSLLCILKCRRAHPWVGARQNSIVRQTPDLRGLPPLNKKKKGTDR